MMSDGETWIATAMSMFLVVIGLKSLVIVGLSRLRMLRVAVWLRLTWRNTLVRISYTRRHGKLSGSQGRGPGPVVGLWISCSSGRHWKKGGCMCTSQNDHRKRR